MITGYTLGQISYYSKIGSSLTKLIIKRLQLAYHKDKLSLSV